LQQIREEREKGNTVNLPAEQIFVNIMAMLVFPFLGRPVLQVILDMDEEAFSQFIAVREAFIPDMLVQMVMKNKS